MRVFLSEVFVLLPQWVSVYVFSDVYVSILNPYHYMHNVNHALSIIAYVCGYTGYVEVMVDLL